MLCVFLIFKKFSESKLRNLNLCHSRSVCSIQHVCRGQYFTLPLSATPRFNNSWSRNHYSDLSLSTLSRYTASSTSPCHCPQHHASTPVDLVTNTQNSLSLSLHLITLHCKQYVTLPLSATPRFNTSWSRYQYSELPLSPPYHATLQAILN